MKTWIYLRQSKDVTGDELAVTRQREDDTRLAELRGWTVTETVTDNDTGASGRRRRPGFERLLAAVEAGEVQAVIAWDMTRLSRNRGDTVRLLEAGERVGLVLAFVRGTDLDLSTPAGQLTADILAGVARHEIKVKGDRQRRAYDQAARAGKPIRGQRPFGYERDGITIRKPEAAALRDAYEHVLAGGSLGGVARAWNSAELLTPQKTRTGEPSIWTAQTVRRTLLNARYAGLRARGRPEHQEIVAPAIWPEIVSEATWRAAVATITDPTRANPPRSGRALLTGVALCGQPGCDSPVHAGASPARRGKDGYRTYRCRAAFGHIGRAAQPVEKYVEAVVVARLSRDDARDLLTDQTRPDVDELRTQALALRRRRQSVLALVADGTFTEAEARDQAATLNKEIAAVEDQMADAGRVDLLGPLVHAEDVQAAWDGYDIDRQRAVIDLLMTVRLLPPGRGTRTFRPETVQVIPR